jgi:NAD(P)-dependent dehydrogenase (short-subunit alcohol dehydrogenase family)
VAAVEQSSGDATYRRFLNPHAGIQTSSPTEELSSDDFDRVLAVNLRAAFLCARGDSPLPGRVDQRVDTVTSKDRVPAPLKAEPIASRR